MAENADRDGDDTSGDGDGDVVGDTSSAHWPTIKKGGKGSQLSIQCNHMVMEAMMMMRW